MDTGLARLLHWAEQTLGPARRILGEGNTSVYQFTSDGRVIPMVVTVNSEGELWMSVWFNSPHTPWMTDLDCARDVARVLGSEVRCAPESPISAEPPDMFVQLQNGREQLINWQDPDN